MTGGQRLLEGVGEGVDGTVPLGYLETIEVRTVNGMRPSRTRTFTVARARLLGMARGAADDDEVEEEEDGNVRSSFIDDAMSTSRRSIFDITLLALSSSCRKPARLLGNTTNDVFP
jgi:hypothetical protein